MRYSEEEQGGGECSEQSGLEGLDVGDVVYSQGLKKAMVFFVVEHCSSDQLQTNE